MTLTEAFLTLVGVGMLLTFALFQIADYVDSEDDD